jgi:hypothetical protein
MANQDAVRARAHFPRLDFPRLVHSAYHICSRCGLRYLYATLRDGVGSGLPRWYIYHKKWYIYHFEVIWLRVGILLKSQIPGNIKHWRPAPRAVWPLPSQPVLTTCPARCASCVPPRPSCVRRP